MLALYIAGRSTPNRATESMLPPDMFRAAFLTISRQVALHCGAVRAGMLASSPTGGMALCTPLDVARAD